MPPARVRATPEDDSCGRKGTDPTIGTLADPIMVRSAGEEQYLGCTGVPADSHNVIWLTVCAPLPLLL